MPGRIYTHKPHHESIPDLVVLYKIYRYAPNKIHKRQGELHQMIIWFFFFANSKSLQFYGFCVGYGQGNLYMYLLKPILFCGDFRDKNDK